MLVVTEVNGQRWTMRVRHGRRTGYACASCLFIVLTLGLCNSSASALTEHVFSTTFGAPCSSHPCGSGQFNEPAGVAVSDSTGDVYVVDRADNRVEQFSSTGVFVGQFNGSAAPTGALSSPEAIAVDNSVSPLDPSAGDVYVADRGHSVVDKFSATGVYLGQVTKGAGGSALGEPYGVAVDPNGGLWVYQSSGEIDGFTDADANEFETACNSPFGTEPGFAVDGEDNLYVNRGARVVAKLDGTCAVLIEDVGEQKEGEEATTGVAVEGSSGNVFLDNIKPFEGETSSIVEFSPMGALIQRFGKERVTTSSDVGVNAANGVVYVSYASTDSVDIFTALVLADVTTGGASNVSETSATVSGTVNPNGVAVTSCRFEYGTTLSYGQSAPCSSAPGAGKAPVPVTAALTNLQPGRLYHYRLAVTDANGESQGRDATLATISRPVVSALSVSDVTSDGATLHARIDPGGRQTTYRFEYDIREYKEGEGPHGVSVPFPEGDAGTQLEGAAVSVQPQKLQAHTTYHYRVVAVNDIGTTQTADATFTTRPVAGPFMLPDGRAWEMVSPPSKHGGTVLPLLGEGVAASSIDGGGFTFLTDQSLFAEPQGAPTFAQVLARRTPMGWSSEDISPPHSTPPGQGLGQGQEYRLFSPDLSLALVEPFGAYTEISSEATERTPYVRHDLTCEASPSTCYQPLVTAANVPAGTKFGGSPTRPQGTQGIVKFVSATPDLSHVVLRVEEAGLALTPTAVTDGLYEWVGGRLQLVSEDESHAAVNRGNLGYENQDVSNAISEDGSRVFWEGVVGFEPHLYVRDTVNEKSYRIDVVQPGALGKGNASPEFQTASADGSRVFFTDQQQLTTDSGAGGSGLGEKADLYECELIEVAGKLTCNLTDLTPPLVSGGESAEVQGFVLGLGAGADTSHLYFVAKGVLAANENGATHEKATPGGDNLYALHNDGGKWTTTFIASLAGEDAAQWKEPKRMANRISPNGRYLAFMSDRSLTGYDNTDANSGRPDEEVFLYDAEAAPHLVCVSCDPTGAPPAGTLEVGAALDLVDHIQTWMGRWVAANIPTWETLNADENPIYQPRYLSNQGRLFFNSADALVPRDVNGQWDVYQYEPAGSAPACTEASETFSQQTDGCVSLISPGTSSEESGFLDASESGGDVFFVTEAKLSPRDIDDQLDVYDAHECSLSPCIAAPAAGATPDCVTSEACRPGSSSASQTFGAPASATFSGTGNVAAVTPPSTKPRSSTRARKLAKALKACRRRPKRSRAKCRSAANRRYGTQASAGKLTHAQRSGR